MNALTLGDLKLGLDHFFDKIAPLLRETASGKLVLGDLEKYHQTLLVLPPALLGSLPNAAELRRADRLFDRSYKGLRLVVDGALELPDLRPEVRSTLEWVRERFVPRVTETNGSYADESALCRQRRPLIAEKRQALAAILLPDGTGFDVGLERMCTYGESLDQGLQSRTAAQLEADRSEAAALRSPAISSLLFLEASLEREVRANPALPADLPRLALAYFHQLAEMRETQNQAARRADGQGEAGPSAGPTA